MGRVQLISAAKGLGWRLAFQLVTETVKSYPVCSNVNCTVVVLFGSVHTVVPCVEVAGGMNILEYFTFYCTIPYVLI